MADAPEAPARVFAWLRLFGAFGVASDAKKLILAAVGLVVAYAGWALLDRAFSHAGGPAPPWAPPEPAASLAPITGMTVYPVLTVVRTDVAQPPADPAPGEPFSLWASVRTAPWRLTEPVRAVVGPFLPAFSPQSSTAVFLHALLSAGWGVLVWAFIGGAIARIALLQVARSRTVSLTGAARFAASRTASLVAAPLCPLLAIVALVLPCALFGLLYRVPGIGATAAGVLAFLPLLAGLVMTVVLVGLALAWPLMPPAVAAEGEDAFDALSRSFAYVNQRRGHYLGYVLLAWLIGWVGLVFVDVFARLVVHLAEWALSFTAPGDVLAGLWTGGGGQMPATAGAHRFWIGAVLLLAHAWIYSYFWSSSAIAYLLLRRDVDGTPFHEIDAAETMPRFDEPEAGAAPTAQQPAAPAQATEVV